MYRLQDHWFDREHLAKELGDVAPDGFDAEHSIHRREDDV